MALTATSTPAPADLGPAYYVDSDDPTVVAWAESVTAGAADDRERAVRLYLWVRDRIRYDPYVRSDEPMDFRASTVVARDRNWCVPKAVLMCAGLRTVGIPARLGYADVRNHLASDKLLEKMGTDLFVFHGYVDVWLDGEWRKATPAFNLEMCSRFGVKPLEFDGTADSIYHPFDVEGRRHMEYVRQRGTYHDLPFEEMQQVFADTYGESSMMHPGDDGAARPHDELFHA